MNVSSASDHTLDVMPADAAERTRAAYSAAADRYDDPALAFWGRFGRATVERMGLAPGMRVFDACCGSGASALPAAEKVRSEGRVLAVDLAEPLLALGRAKAAARGLTNVEFRCDEFLATPEPPASFDAVACVFGIFFIPDMVAAARGLWRLVRPGGRLAVTTWGPRFFEPANSLFWDAVRDERPDLVRGFHPWDRISEPAALAALLTEAGIPDANVVAEAAVHPLRSAEDMWTIVMGSGYRGTLNQLTPEAQSRVRARLIEGLTRDQVNSIEANVVYALAPKSGAPAASGSKST
jgi:ubiquinone/menaquinone biosynthesis C-methylase UbiE